MTALEFLTYCAGISTVIVSTGAAIRLGRRPPAPSAPARSEQASLEPPDPAADALAARLRAFQGARFASPIVQRSLDPQAVPLRRPVRSTPATPAPTGERSPKKEG